jgi:hypothetical protein
MVKDFNEYLNEGLLDRNASEFTIVKSQHGDVREQIEVETLKEFRDIYLKRAAENIKEIDLSDLHIKIKPAYGAGVPLTTKMISDIDQVNGRSVADELRSIVLPYGITKLDDYIFQLFEKLEKVVLPDTVQIIGNYAFNICKSLKEINIPDGVEHIMTHAFDRCAFERITLPKSLSGIGSYAFKDCKNLKEINWDVNLEYLSYDNDKKLTIANNVFDGCDNLERINAPKEFTEYLINSFFGTKKIKLYND